MLCAGSGLPTGASKMGAAIISAFSLNASTIGMFAWLSPSGIRLSAEWINDQNEQDVKHRWYKGLLLDSKAGIGLNSKNSALHLNITV
jgi:hypothetical protein